jgi:hypothetical protein
MARASSGWQTRKSSFINGKTSNLASTSCHYLAFTKSVMQSCSTPHRMKDGRIIHVILPVAGWPATRLGRESACQYMPPGPIVFCRPLGVREYFLRLDWDSSFLFRGKWPRARFHLHTENGLLRLASSGDEPTRSEPCVATRPYRSCPALDVLSHGDSRVWEETRGADSSLRPHRALLWPPHPEPPQGAFDRSPQVATHTLTRVAPDARRRRQSTPPPPPRPRA